MKFKFKIAVNSAIIIFFILSCTPVKYQVVYRSNKAINVSSGKWLVNSIEGDFSFKEGQVLTDNLIKGLRKAGIDSLYYIDDVILDYITPDHLSFKLTDDILKLLKETTDFDFLINVRTEKLNDNLGDIMFSPPDAYSTSKSEVSIIIYDIRQQQEIYDQQVIARVEMDETDEELNFSKSASSLIFNALNKGLKEIKKYSVK